MVDSRGFLSGSATTGVMEDHKLAVAENDIVAVEGGVSTRFAVKKTRHLQRLGDMKSGSCGGMCNTYGNSPARRNSTDVIKLTRSSCARDFPFLTKLPHDRFHFLVHAQLFEICVPSLANNRQITAMSCSPVFDEIT